MEPLTILIADDDCDITKSCMKLFMRDLQNANVTYVRTPDECRAAIRKQCFDLVFLDINFSQFSCTGLDLLPEIRTTRPSTKVFMLSSMDDDKTVITSMALGAADFIPKKNGKVLDIVNVIKNFKRDEEMVLLDIEEGKRIAAEMGIAFTSSAMTKIFGQVAFARRNKDTAVLITGETGVGKEVVAQAIAYQNKDKKITTIDCGAISSGVAESEFFGHMKGSFTGAIAHKTGKFYEADGGDLFLDEIGNLKSDVQEMLLRATQTKEITPVGGSETKKLDVRLIFATNENLDKMVNEKRFRQDFLERIRGIWIEIPPLRERPEDIPVIVCSQIAKSSPGLKIVPTCMSLLTAYAWPGNVRELEKIVNHLMAQAHSGPISVRHLPKHFFDLLGAQMDLATSLVAGEIRIPGRYAVSLQGSLESAHADFTRQYLADRYVQLGDDFSKRQLAKELGIARTTLDRYETDLNLDFSARGEE